MKYAIDETELARLEALAGQYTNAVPNNIYEDCRDTLSRSVPALVAEVRRLRKKVEAWEWYNECRIYDPWREHQYCTACGRSSHLRKDQNSIGTRRARALENAIAEWHAIVEAAREAVHADRE